ncbi:uncharacterized protein [Arachis hypogaea]|uniref:uncharacterized protein n=1 Tax=Arachis hypogaea TaxID=3818 RepID=UPI003B2149F1
MTIKIDLEKAYNRLKWNFIKDTLIEIGLPNNIIHHGFWKPIRIKRDSPEISHLCFADDLILFAKASLNQAEVINKCLNAFCESSGQKVSQHKTRIFFSKNVRNNVRRDISEALGFARTDDLGKYLGVSILHSRVSGHTYHDIINKINTKLNL